MDGGRRSTRASSRLGALGASLAATVLALLGGCTSSVSAGPADESTQTCISWVQYTDEEAKAADAAVVVDAVVHGRAGERAMFGTQAAVWDVEVTAVEKGDVEVGDRIDVASTPVTCSGATYPEGDPLDTRAPARLYLSDGDFAVPGTEAGLALITPTDGVAPVGGEHGDAATWELRDAGAVTAQSRSVDISVTRLGCASGVTGETREPQVRYEAEQIVIVVDVAPFGEGAADCQGNDAVPVTVELAEPIGERQLVDGACLAGEAVGTTVCTDEVRWP